MEYLERNLYRLRQLRTLPKYSLLYKNGLGKKEDYLYKLLAIFCVAGGIVFFINFIQQTRLLVCFNWAIQIGIFATLIYIFLTNIDFKSFKLQSISKSFSSLNNTAKLALYATLIYIAIIIINNAYAITHKKVFVTSFYDIFYLYVFWVVFTLSVFFGTKTYNKIFGFLNKAQLQLQPVAPALEYFWVGESTGELSKLQHKLALTAKQQILLSLRDAMQNILILGGIGTGKTKRAIHSLLLQLLDGGCGGLIFDIKGDFKKSVLSFADALHIKPVIIGQGAQQMNLLAGLTPEMASSFLRSLFMLNRSRVDSFWTDTATELCRNTLGVLSFAPEYYSLNGLYNYLFDPEAKQKIQKKVEAAIVNLAADKTKEITLFATYSSYQQNVFSKFDDKVRSGVFATLAQVLAPFNHPDLMHSFCTESPQSAQMEKVLDGAIYLVDLPLAKWGFSGKVIYTLIKLRFFNVMQQRTSRPEWNQERPVFFMCDEYQEVVSANKEGLSDLNFWDKSRSSKTIGIISAQAISSFYAAIGDKDLANALLQNFRQKICFKTEDRDTLEYFKLLGGEAEIDKKVKSKTKSSAHGYYVSGSRTESVSQQNKLVLLPQVFRGLQIDQAIALLNINGQSMDDIVSMPEVDVA